MCKPQKMVDQNEVSAIACVFFTDFSTEMLKIWLASQANNFPAKRKSRLRRRLTAQVNKSSARNFLQQFLIDVEIRMHMLHIVMIFECLNQANHRRGV